jgi:hypothetical protein
MSGDVAQTQRASIKRLRRSTCVHDTMQLQRLCHGVGKELQSCVADNPWLSLLGRVRGFVGLSM